MTKTEKIFLTEEDLEKINAGLEVQVQTKEGLCLTFIPPVIASPEGSARYGKNEPGGNEDILAPK